MIKILDLFAGTQSVRKAITEKYKITKWILDENKVWNGLTKKGEYEYDRATQYIGIDIYSPEFTNLILDLSQEKIIEKLESVLPINWKPDFIWASPVCNKFSRVLTAEGGNYYFEVKENKIFPRENWNIKGIQPHMQKFNNEDGRIKARQDALNALKMYDNLKLIINYFNVPFAIENPKTALSKYILSEYVKNYCNYCQYEFKYKKPTTIYTNKKIELKTCVCKEKHLENITNTKTSLKFKSKRYADRSKVPPKLIVDILERMNL